MIGEILQASQENGMVSPLSTELRQCCPQAVQGSKIQRHVNDDAPKVTDHQGIVLWREGEPVRLACHMLGGRGGGGEILKNSHNFYYFIETSQYTRDINR